jgi:circadian clock protein KaiC
MVPDKPRFVGTFDVADPGRTTRASNQAIGWFPDLRLWVRSKWTMMTSDGQAATGIAGVDAVLHGGLPLGENTLLIGGPGSGKTMFALQVLVNGALADREVGLFVSFEQSPAKLLASAEGFGLRPSAENAAGVHIFDARPVLDSIESGNFDIGGLLAIVSDEVRRHSIRRIVFDGLDAVFAFGGDREMLGREFRRLVQFTNAERLTSIVCMKPNHGEGPAEDFDFLEYTADAVVRLGYRVTNGLVRRILRVVKVRGASFAAGEHPFIITSSGIELLYFGLQKPAMVLSETRISSGVTKLDDMLEGGLLRSTVTLVSGLPGTAKSTLGASFLAAALQRGDRCLLVGLDEPAEQLIDNVRSVGIEMQTFFDSGQLTALSLNAGAAIADEHFLAIRRAVETADPSVLVIDPISALAKAGGSEVAILVVEQLTSLVKERGMTAIFTAVADTQLGNLESTTVQISTIADSWIHLSFAVKGGERNRTLTIVKARGTAHSNQVRELTLSGQGIDLADVYQIQGDFLLGAARLEREQQDRRETHEADARSVELLRGLGEQRDVLRSRLADTERELEDVDKRVALNARQTSSRVAEVERDRSEVLARREGVETHVR